MDPINHTCQSLIHHCKNEAKHLLEANVTNRKIHWTHSSFVSFCSAVDDVLSYEVNKKYRVFNTTSRQWLTSSGRVLQEMSKTYPVAMSIYTMCYSSRKTNTKSSSRPDYSLLQSKSRLEYKILWIRTAILEKTLKAIVEEILRKPERYYSGDSILCHSVYGELFTFLLDGPCSLNLSRMRSIDTSLISPGPSEIINRYSRVLPASSVGYTTYQQDSLSSEVWGHIQSLYQTSVTTCLFGKNNILIKPPDYSHPLEGYLTLVQFEASLLLKWLPNALINRNKDDNDSSSERFHILSLDITNDVAHVHCHQGPGLNESEINLIGYNGIAYPALCFPQPMTLLHFLESLEDGLHPRGCLEPPLWFLRQSNDIFPSTNSSVPPVIKSSDIPKDVATPPLNNKGFPVTWNHVFRVRFSRLVPHHHGDETAEWEEGHETSPIEENGIIISRSPTVKIRNMSTSKRRRSARLHWLLFLCYYSDGLEQLQGKVCYQLLARYFYSWLSYCRHMNRVKTSLSHLVIKPSANIVTNRQDDHIPLNELAWSKFIGNKNEDTWAKVVWQIYDCGISPTLRTQVWPYLLKVFPHNATASEIEAIIQQYTIDYEDTLMKWKELEHQHYNNNDPTSTSKEIRLGMNNTGFTGILKKKGKVNLQETMDANMEETNDLIELDSKEDGDNDSELSAILETDIDREIDSGCEDHPHTAMSGDDEVILATPLSTHEEKFLEELLKIDKDIPRCDRDYWYFQNTENLTKLRNIISSYIWMNTETGYSQGMCDLVAPLLVTFDDEKIAFVCFQKLMNTMEHYFPPKSGVQERMNNLRSLLQILESDFFQYLSELPMGDSLFYSYRWFLVNFKREFVYKDIFLLWETCWAAQWCTTMHFEVFVAMAIIQQYKSAIMDAQLDASEILNLFTDLSEKKALNCTKTLSYAQSVVSHIHQDSNNT